MRLKKGGELLTKVLYFVALNSAGFIKDIQQEKQNRRFRNCVSEFVPRRHKFSEHSSDHTYPEESPFFSLL